MIGHMIELLGDRIYDDEDTIESDALIRYRRMIVRHERREHFLVLRQLDGRSIATGFITLNWEHRHEFLWHVVLNGVDVPVYRLNLSQRTPVYHLVDWHMCNIAIALERRFPGMPYDVRVHRGRAMSCSTQTYRGQHLFGGGVGYALNPDNMAALTRLQYAGVVTIQGADA